MFALLALSVVNLFMIALSRGRALAVSAISTSLAVVLWAMWQGLGPDDVAGSDFGSLAPIGLLIIAIVYAVAAGLLTVLQTVRNRGTYLLAMIAAVLGLWWTVGVSLESGLSYGTLVDVAVAIGTVAPLGFVVAQIGKGWKEDRGRAEPTSPSGAPPAGPSAIAALVIAVSGYLAVVEPVVSALTFAFTTVLPDVLQVPRPASTSEPGWLIVLDWRSAISSIGILGGVALILAASVSAAGRNLRSSKYTDFRTTTQRVQGADPVSIVAVQLSRAAVQAGRIMQLIAVFTWQTVVEFARRGRATIQRIGLAVWTAVRFFFVVPVVVLGAAGVVMLAAIRDALTYDNGAATGIGGAELWGGMVSAAVAVLVLCGVSFGLSPLSPKHQRFALNGLGASAMLAAGFWALVSVGSMATWPLWRAFRNLGGAEALSLGDALWTNHIAVIALAVVFAITGPLFQKNSETLRRSLRILLIAALVAVLSFAIVLGWPLLSQWFGYLLA